MEKITFPVVIREDEESGYIAACPAIAGCYSQGNTIDFMLVLPHEEPQSILISVFQTGDQFPFVPLIFFQISCHDYPNKYKGNMVLISVCP